MENHSDVTPVHLLLATAAGPARVYGDVLREEEGELEKCQVRGRLSFFRKWTHVGLGIVNG